MGEKKSYVESSNLPCCWTLAKKTCHKKSPVIDLKMYEINLKRIILMYIVLRSDYGNKFDFLRNELYTKDKKFTYH